MEFLIAGVFFGVVCIIWAYKNKKRAFGAFNAFDSLEPWFEENHFNTDQVRFSTYDERSLVATEGSVVLVGQGPTSTKGTVGFVAEVHPRLGVQEALILDRSVASWHKMAAVEAKTTGKSLVHAIKVRQHKAGLAPSTRSVEELEMPADPLPIFSFPDVGKYKPESQWQHGRFFVAYFKDVLPLAARVVSRASDLKMDHAMVVMDRELNPIFMVAAERFDMSASGPGRLVEEVPSLCVKAVGGQRENLGASSEWYDRDKFMNRAGQIILERFPLE